MNYHRAKSKETVFEINRATKSLESGLYYALGDVIRQVFEIIFIGLGLYFTSGPKYLAMMVGTFTLYTLWTLQQARAVMPVMRAEK